MFDGVHRGHKAIIKAATDYARKNNIASAAISLENHPRELTQGKAPMLITDVNSRLALLEELGLDYVLLLSFDEDLMQMPAEDYLKKYLVGILNAEFISIGYDHHFGRNREGTPKMLSDWCSKQSVGLHIEEAFNHKNYLVSSSLIRSLIKESKVELANDILGHDFFIIGKIVKGDGRGHRLGFPTANILFSEQIVLPKAGVYLGELSEGQNKYQAVINIGYRPTFKTELEISLEAHLLDFEGDLYNKKIKLSFQKHLRDEIKFESAELLVEQINKDLSKAKQILKEGV